MTDTEVTSTDAGIATTSYSPSPHSSRHMTPKSVIIDPNPGSTQSLPQHPPQTPPQTPQPSSPSRWKAHSQSSDESDQSTPRPTTVATTIDKKYNKRSRMSDKLAAVLSPPSTAAASASAGETEKPLEPICRSETYTVYGPARPITDKLVMGTMVTSKKQTGPRQTKLGTFVRTKVGGKAQRDWLVAGVVATKTQRSKLGHTLKRVDLLLLDEADAAAPALVAIQFGKITTNIGTKPTAEQLESCYALLEAWVNEQKSVAATGTEVKEQQKEMGSVPRKRIIRKPSFYEPPPSPKRKRKQPLRSHMQQTKRELERDAEPERERDFKADPKHKAKRKAEPKPEPEPEAEQEPDAEPERDQCRKKKKGAKALVSVTAGTRTALASTSTSKH
jgi:hypothetical protein